MVDLDLSYCELRSKELINSIDGKRLGRIVDLVFSAETGRIKGLIAPVNRRAFFSKAQDIFVPWCCVKKIGEDVIIVEITQDLGCRPRGGKAQVCYEMPPPQPEPCCEEPCAEPPPGPDCDGRCEKCMLFDCESRWKNEPGGTVYVDNKKYNRP